MNDRPAPVPDDRNDGFYIKDTKGKFVTTVSQLGWAHSWRCDPDQPPLRFTKTDAAAFIDYLARGDVKGYTIVPIGDEPGWRANS